MSAHSPPNASPERALMYEGAQRTASRSERPSRSLGHELVDGLRQDINRPGRSADLSGPAGMVNLDSDPAWRSYINPRATFGLATSDLGRPALARPPSLERRRRQPFQHTPPITTGGQSQHNRSASDCSVNTGNPFSRPVLPPARSPEQQQTHLPGLPRWQPDEEITSCPICGVAFTFWYRKHHCRKCGRVVCASCSPHRITIPRQFIVHPPDMQALDTRRSDSSSHEVIDLTGEHERQPTADRTASNPLSHSGEGGEEVRLCNPCVPDPNPLPHNPQQSPYSRNLPENFGDYALRRDAFLPASGSQRGHGSLRHRPVSTLIPSNAIHRRRPDESVFGRSFPFSHGDESMHIVQNRRHDSDDLTHDADLRHRPQPRFDASVSEVDIFIPDMMR